MENQIQPVPQPPVSEQTLPTVPPFYKNRTVQVVGVSMVLLNLVVVGYAVTRPVVKSAKPSVVDTTMVISPTTVPIVSITPNPTLVVAATPTINKPGFVAMTPASDLCNSPLAPAAVRPYVRCYYRQSKKVLLRPKQLKIGLAKQLVVLSYPKT